MRDMFKDPEEYDRRMANIANRQKELSHAQKTRETSIKRAIEEKSKNCFHREYQSPQEVYSNRSSREASVTKERPPSRNTNEDVYVRNRVTRYTPEPERNFTMYVHGPRRSDLAIGSTLGYMRPRPSTNTDSPFQRKTNTSRQPPTFYGHSEPTPNSWYVVRRAASSGQVGQGTSSEIVNLSRPSTPTASLNEEKVVNDNRPSFYTDKYFSSSFLSDSVPLSKMLVYKK